MGKLRILLAEDNKENQEITRHLLEKAGYAVDIAENGRKAVATAKAVLFDLILMDIQMPEMDGLTAAKEIRKLDNGRHAPIIAFTAFADDTLRRQCLFLGMNDFLAKPVAEQDLLRCLERWLSREHAILVADDMEDIRNLIEHYLRKTPYRAVFAKNGLDAIACFNKMERVSLILLDMEMPVMDGYTAARALASLMGKKRVPIIAMTAHEGEGAIAKCLKAGCTGYLGKPIAPEALALVLEEHLGEKVPFLPEDMEQKTPGEFIVYIDPELKELVPRFLDNRRKDAGEISRLLSEGDLEAVRIIGHSMAGSAGGYGFQEIGKMGKAIEDAALKNRYQEIREVCSRLSEYLSRVTVIIRSWQK